MNESAIFVRGLVRSFGERRAVDELDIDVAKHEFLGLLGPNGAGKTTTIQVLATLLAPTQGQVRVLGLDPATQGSELRQRIGLVPQEIALYDELSAAENLEFLGKIYGLRGTRLGERVNWALQAAGLEDRRRSRVGEFSGGMKRRLNLVSALLHEPELVFLDEPTAGVDPQSRNHLFEMIEGLRGQVTLVYTTHLMGEVERLCDRIVVMDEGRLVAAGTLAELHAAQAAKAGESRTLELAQNTDMQAATALLREHGFEVECGSETPDLESIFLALTGKDLRDGSE
ncbi:MAG: ABC-2 type transport system ATP-binding protein [Planctomycetota bacterium]|jgi:ABC-2 type transport system ATP-binding protein